jgi:hypothetical protein
MRYRLRTLQIVLALGPMLLAGAYLHPFIAAGVVGAVIYNVIAFRVLYNRR